MNSAEIRTAYLEFFASKGHQVVESSSLVPDNDPTLLFTNSGMVQFKEALALREDRGYKRAVSCQRCLRAGGKHNDLENVGYTARHHTFFEMLGNFSFGDYFKREAITWAWEFLTEVLKLPSEKLWVTVHLDDDEAEAIWVNEVGVSPDRVTRLGDEDNFWTMGDTGPCGPCSEIFYDHGEDIPGGPPGSEDDDLDRYVEIWNLVFTQFDRSADGTLTPLPKPCVDTGMGFERLAAVMQGVHDNYDIDLFTRLRSTAAELLGCSDPQEAGLKVIADHLRSATFLIADGVLPSNEGRGYVLRRIIRRALRHGHKLNASSSFFHHLVPVLVEEMGEAYPIIRQTMSQISRVLEKEEEQFALTLDQGMKILGAALMDQSGAEIPGDVIFKLYDTYGFPVDLTADIARERNLGMDMIGFDQAMDAQRERARAASKFGDLAGDSLDLGVETQFCGYDTLANEAVVLALVHNGNPVDKLQAGEEGAIVLAESPFYAESGGQAGDRGAIIKGDFCFEVSDTRKVGEAFLHQGVLQSGTIQSGDKVNAAVNAETRDATRLNHSATHLLHAALRQILGEHVNQRGSLVDAQRLRFDFSHFEAVTAAQLREIERLVNEQIRHNSLIQTDIMDIEAARAKGAMALFGEKYSQTVRVLTMGDGFSVELCGGTHASRTGDIGVCKIVSEQGIASGVRRIEALTGQTALAYLEGITDSLNETAGLLKADTRELPQKVKNLLEQNKALGKEVASLGLQLASGGGAAETAEEISEIKGVRYLVKEVPGASPKTLPDLMDRMKGKVKSGVVVLASVNEGKVSLIAGVTKDVTGKLHAGELVNFLAQQLGGKGGGRPDMARAGGTDPKALPGALSSVEGWLAERL